MKKLIVLILLVFCCSACSSVEADVALFNTQTETTISLYEDTLAIAKDHEVELIHGIYTGDITLPCGENLDYSEATTLMNTSSDTFIEATPFIESSNFYTRLGMNSVTQVTYFYFQGTKYVLQVLWANCKIDMLVLEVTD